MRLNIQHGVFVLTLAIATIASPALAAGWVTLDTPSNSGSVYTGFSLHGETGIAVSSLDLTFTNDSGVMWTDGAFASGIWGTPMHDVVMTSATNAVVVGASGTIMRTQDGGETWTSAESGTSRTLYAVDKYDTTLYAVGASGTVLKSTDSGATWTDMSFGETNDFYDVDMVSAELSWMVGEAGMAYERLESMGWWTADADTSFDIYAVTGVGTTAWIAGEGEYVATMESLGTSWDEIVLEERDVVDTIDDIVFVSETKGYLTRADGCMWQSTDAGVTWSSMSGTCATVYTDIESSGGVLFAAAFEDDKIIQVYDDDAPVVSAVSATMDETEEDGTFSVTATDTYGVASCTLSVQSTAVSEGDVYTMTDTGDGETFTLDYTFSTAGEYDIAASCTDEGGNSRTGSTTTLQIAEHTEVDDTYFGELIKTACSEGYTVNDPCTAVYYVTDDGQRHAFPNEKVYFTWYSDFDDVVTVSADTMASFTLGSNVTYKPGVTMVKFQTLTTVYAVAEGGVLRAVGSESVAASLYGSDWNTHDVDDISDAFYSNYSFGANINSASDYDVSAALTGTSTIDENF